MDDSRNILIAVLALRSGLIDAEQFAAVCDEYAANHDLSLADMLVERGWVSRSGRDDLLRRLEEKLSAHNGDARSGLGTEVDDDIRAVLTAIADTHIHTTVAGLPPRPRDQGQPSPRGARLNEEPPGKEVTGTIAWSQAGSPEKAAHGRSPSVFGATITAGPSGSFEEGHVPLSSLAFTTGPEERYTLTKLHAKGGIGQVWLARDAALGREVALKELRPERSENLNLWERFLVEARITGQLEHPGIVPIYELARRGDDNHPFYTMRFVQGRTLDEATSDYHAKRKEDSAGPLDLLGLLNAFVGVCNTVAYAHSRGIIHRDLKGKNIVLGNFGEVIVLDWGLAKHVDSPSVEGEDGAVPASAPTAEGAHLQATVAGQVVGTPAYMPPEQAEGRLNAIGRKSDVYSLGAILYEILAGTSPFTGSNTTEVLRKVIKEAPVPPRAHNPEAPRSLEAVCLKAMAKSPDERYESAAALADEVQRFLADEPVSAYPDPLSKQAARWARRNKTAVAAASVLVATSVLALSVGAVLVSRERDQARRQREQARRAVDEMYTEVAEKWLEDRLDPLQKQFLERALAYYEGFAHDTTAEPIVRQERGRAYLRVGDILKKLGRHDEAEKAYRRATEVLGRLARDVPSGTEHRFHGAHAQHQLGVSLAARGSHEEAEALLKRALSTQEAISGPPAAPTRYRQDLAMTNKSLGDLNRIRGKRSDAEAFYRRAVEIGEALVTANPSEPSVRNDLSAAYDKLGLINRELGKNQDAEKAYRRSLELQNALAADYPTLPRHREVLANGLNGLGVFLQTTGRDDEAETTLRRAVEVAERLATDFPLRPEHRRNAAKIHLDLGSLLAEKKSGLAEAEQNHRRAIALYESLTTEVADVAQYRYDLARTYNDLGMLLRSTKDKTESEQLFKKAVSLYEALIADGSDVPGYRRGLSLTLNNLGLLNAETGRNPEAEAAYRRSIDLREALEREYPEAPDHRTRLAQTLKNLGNLLRRSERPDDAWAAYRRAAEITETLVKQFPEVPDHRLSLATILNSLAGLKPPDAEAIYRRVIELADGLVQQYSTVPRYRVLLAIGRQNLAELLAARGSLVEAEAAFRQAAAGLEQLVNEHPTVIDYQIYLAEVLKNLGTLRQERGDVAEARTLLERAATLAHAASNANPRSPALRRNMRTIDTAYAGALLATLDHTGASRVADDMVKVAPDRPLACVDAARVFAGCVPLAERDAKLAEGDQRAQAQKYAARAVGLLREAIGAGYRDVNKLNTDEAFGPLRSRDDFKALPLPASDEKPKPSTASRPGQADRVTPRTTPAPTVQVPVQPQ
jgi:serine/threonine protein kinase/Flp pilus assembly protein TadD